MDQAHIQRSAVARLLLEVFNDQIYKYGFVHSDPHPGTSGPGGRRLLVPSRLMLCGRCGTGNILVRVHKHRPQIVLLDHGLYMSLTPEFRYLSLPPPPSSPTRQFLLPLLTALLRSAWCSGLTAHPRPVVGLFVCLFRSLGWALPTCLSVRSNGIRSRFCAPSSRCTWTCSTMKTGPFFCRLSSHST